MDNFIEAPDVRQAFTENYRRNLSVINKHSARLLNERRDEAFELFTRLGIPGKKSENYKYTDAGSLFLKPIGLNMGPNAIHVDIHEIFKCDVPELDTHMVLMVNGFYFGPEPALKEVEGKVLIGSLAAAAREYPELVARHYTSYAKPGTDGLVALNTAFAQDGLFLYIPDGVALLKPIQVINLSIWEKDLMVQSRNLFLAGKNSRAKLVVCDHTLAPWRFLNNTVTEVYVDRGGIFDMVKMQNENNSSQHFSHTYALQEGTSSMSFNTISLHGGLIRNNFYALLNGEHAENHTYGLYLSDRKQHIDNYSFIDHANPHCTSNQLFKGVLDDEATGAFTGKILVRKDAQKTLAYQANNNILLTDQARMNSKPQLEIYADDVKCSHGSTVGQLDPDAMFYLRSRGIETREARLMLMYAFADDVISHIPVGPLRERIEMLVNKRLRGELSRCNACQISSGKMEC